MAKITNIHNNDDYDNNDDDDDNDNNNWNGTCSQKLADSVIKKKHASIKISGNVIFYNKQKCSFTLKISCL
jgi:hypothetical protein